MAYSSAGHPPVLVLPPAGPPYRLTDAQSLPLCALSAEPRPERSVTLDPGSLVVMYSDGLVERRRRPIEAGIARIEQLMVELAGRPASEVADRLVADISSESPPDDDIVVACFRYTPTTARYRRSIPSRGAALAGLRAELREWLVHVGVTEATQYRVLLGVGEACANAVEHAYLGSGRGHIDVELSHHGEHLTARVRDHGTWRPPARLAADRGRGTAVMKSVGDHFARRSGGDGTTVTLTLPVGPAGREQPISEPAR